MSLATSFILIALFVIIYVVLIEIFAVLFRITGLTKEKSKFQAISLLTGCGFTTSESEVIMTDKARRRIAISAMITGNAFSVIIVSLLINVFLSLNTQAITDSLWIIVVCMAAAILIIILLRIPYLRTAFDKFIEIVAIKVFKRNSRENVLTLLDNYGKDAIVEILLNKIPDVLYGKSLMESKIKDNYKMNFLMYNRKGKIHDITKDTIFQKGDIIVVFGSYQNVKDLFTSGLEHVDKLLDKTEVKIQNDLDLMENYGSDAMVEVKINVVPKAIEDKPLFEAKVKEEYKINIMMIKRDDMPILVSKDTIIQKNDSIIVFGPYQNIKKLFIINNSNDNK